MTASDLGATVERTTTTPKWPESFRNCLGRNKPMKEHLEEVDAALLGGDLLEHDGQREEVREYAERWLRVIKEHESLRSAVQIVRRHVRACGPVTFPGIVFELTSQTELRGHDAESAAVDAINELTRAGEIELYETGDAWEPV
jgi:hypothetical protein